MARCQIAVAELIAGLMLMHRFFNGNRDAVQSCIWWIARLAARERLRALKLDGPDADVKDPAWARLLKWWLTPYPDRPPFP